MKLRLSNSEGTLEVEGLEHEIEKVVTMAAEKLLKLELKWPSWPSFTVGCSATASAINPNGTAAGEPLNAGAGRPPTGAVR